MVRRREMELATRRALREAARAPATRRPIGPWIAAAVVAAALAIFGFVWVPGGPGPGPDLDCPDIGHQVRIGDSDPHGLDADGDGIGCERDGKQFGWLGWVGLLGAAGAGFQAYRIRQPD